MPNVLLSSSKRHLELIEDMTWNAIIWSGMRALPTTAGDQITLQLYFHFQHHEQLGNATSNLFGRLRLLSLGSVSIFFDRTLQSHVLTK
jgi:hypothetical protein